jgi:hypothetical protein
MAENPENSKSRKLRIPNDSKSQKTQNLEKFKISKILKDLANFKNLLKLNIFVVLFSGILGQNMLQILNLFKAILKIHTMGQNIKTCKTFLVLKMYRA